MHQKNYQKKMKFKKQYLKKNKNFILKEGMIIQIKM